MTSIFLAPHNDDETLFGSFTLQREKPHVVVCLYESEERVWETKSALYCLGLDFEKLEQWQYTDVQNTRLWKDIKDLSVKYDHAYAPLPYGKEWESNRDHDVIGELARVYFAGRVTFYHTYTWPQGRMTSANRVPYDGEMVRRKINAIASYTSQMTHPERMDQFLYPQWEYYE